MHPNFLDNQLNKSLDNLGLSTLDLLYLHNSYESWGPEVTDPVYFDKLATSFEWAESKVSEGKIKSYGLATFLCLRAKPTEDKLHLNLQKVHDLAKKIGGDNHNFKYIQVPMNILMPEAFVEPWQGYT